MPPFPVSTKCQILLAIEVQTHVQIQPHVKCSHISSLQHSLFSFSLVVIYLLKLCSWEQRKYLASNRWQWMETWNVFHWIICSLVTVRVERIIFDWCISLGKLVFHLHIFFAKFSWGPVKNKIKYLTTALQLVFCIFRWVMRMFTFYFSTNTEIFFLYQNKG